MLTQRLPPKLSKSKQEDYLNRMHTHREKSILKFLSSPITASEQAALLVENKERQVLSNHQRTWYRGIRKGMSVSSNLQQEVAQISKAVQKGGYSDKLGYLFTQFSPTIDVAAHQSALFDSPVDVPWAKTTSASFSEYEKLRDNLVERNQRLVVSIVENNSWRLEKTYLDESDLMLSGLIGLEKCISRYNPKEGTFSTFAYDRITNMIKRDIANCGRNVRMPVERQQHVQNYNRLTNQYNNETQLKYSDEELASELGLSPEELDRTIKASKLRCTSLDAEIDEEGTTQYTIIPNDNDFLGEIIKTDSYACVPQLLVNADLTKRQSDVIFRRFGLSPYEETQTYEEIAKVHDVSHQAIQKAEKVALGKIQETVLMSSRADYF